MSGCRRSRIWMSHCKVHGVPGDHIARPHVPYPRDKRRGGRNFRINLWFSARMTSALFWAIDRGKEPCSLAIVLLCLAPVNRLELGPCQLGPQTRCNAIRLCSPTDPAEMQRLLYNCAACMCGLLRATIPQSPSPFQHMDRLIFGSYVQGLVPSLHTSTFIFPISITFR